MRHTERGYADISSLSPAKYNPRKISQHAKEGLKRSIDRFGLVQDIVVNKRNNVVVGGHQRLTVLKESGETSVPVVWVDLNDTDEKALNVTLNNPLISGEFDDSIAGLLNEIRDGIGVDEFAELNLDDLLPPEATVVAGNTDPDDAPEAPEEPITKPGDLWVLGDHRLLCGDSTNVQHVERLMNGQKADVGFTSPPYALGKSAALSGNKANRDRGNAYESHEDNAKDWAQLMADWYAAFGERAEAWCVNVQPLAGNKRALFEWIAHNAIRIIDVAIWAKDTAQPAMAKNVLNSQYELLVFLGKQNASRSIPFADFRGTQSAVYRGSANRENVATELHGAAMPAHLPQWVIGDLFSESKSVVEPFAGTGTTLIVAEQYHRKSYNMEVDPRYCDVIVKRWEDFTGKKAVRE